MRRFTCRFVSSAAIVAAVLINGSVIAKDRESSKPLIVKKRSFLDSGTVVAPGSIQTYATSSTISPMVYTFDDRFNMSLPSPYFAPGRPEPIARFYTPPFDR